MSESPFNARQTAGEALNIVAAYTRQNHSDEGYNGSEFQAAAAVLQRNDGQYTDELKNVGITESMFQQLSADPQKREVWSRTLIYLHDQRERANDTVDHWGADYDIEPEDIDAIRNGSTPLGSQMRDELHSRIDDVRRPQPVTPSTGNNGPASIQPSQPAGTQEVPNTPPVSVDGVALPGVTFEPLPPVAPQGAAGPVRAFNPNEELDRALSIIASATRQDSSVGSGWGSGYSDNDFQGAAAALQRADGVYTNELRNAGINEQLCGQLLADPNRREVWVRTLNHLHDNMSKANDAYDNWGADYDVEGDDLDAIRTGSTQQGLDLRDQIRQKIADLKPPEAQSGNHGPVAPQQPAAPGESTSPPSTPVTPPQPVNPSVPLPVLPDYSLGNPFGHDEGGFYQPVPGYGRLQEFWQFKQFQQFESFQQFREFQQFQQFQRFNGMGMEAEPFILDGSGRFGLSSPYGSFQQGLQIPAQAFIIQGFAMEGYGHSVHSQSYSGNPMGALYGF